MLIVLGIDPGSRVTGFGVIREISGRLSLVDAGTIRTTTDAGMDVRLGQIFFRLTEIISQYQPANSAIENVFQSRNPAAALKLGQARGVAIAACAQGKVPVFSYEPTMVKKSIVGVGRAEKSQVAFMVARLLEVGKPDWAEDASDALAVAICHVNQQRFVRLTEGNRVHG
ncbi:crossover junction endodeoxyribonuclease RuvC [Desulfonatronum thioautotrophicum]|uniref:crossover junction endodeoxyribonuclease RuvC n=1 Tax=Desulfonatronum thioautotrophicum TaxID=617001 RepID=UPI0005EB7975|nr:crossover junction endodeoxyribonuclease RuvC [Desulfonatronum thioautotrophicum]